MDKCFMTREKLSSGSPEKGSEDIPLFANMHTLSLIKVLFIVKLNNSLHAYLSIITKEEADYHVSIVQKELFVTILHISATW